MGKIVCLILIAASVFTSYWWVKDRNRPFTDYLECYDASVQKPVNPKEVVSFENENWEYSAPYENGRIVGRGKWIDREYIGDLEVNNVIAHIYVLKSEPESRLVRLVPPHSDPISQRVYRNVYCRQVICDGKWVSDGMRREEHRDGIVIESPYKLGLLHGIERRWYSNGNRWQDSQFENGKRTGKTKLWGRDGRLIYDDFFIGGKAVKHKVFNRDGTLNEKISFDNRASQE